MKFNRIALVFFACLAMGCRSRTALFELVPSGKSHIEFSNQIIENDSINPFDVTNMYNGAGVGMADFNNDGLTDIYFAGNQVAGQLYLNQGSLQFNNVTAIAGVDGGGKWCRGVAVVDINNDGWQDLYVCATIHADPEKRKNLLYVNQGKNADGIPVFKELAADYGLDDDSHTTMASFFDYDNDGDLDVYLTVNEIIENENPSVYRKRITDGSWPSTGRLYRNDKNDSLGHAFFTDVSKSAGITIEGYGHSACIADVNLDGWKDIFVANDFLSNDILYINNQNGTFTDKSASYFKHTSANGMGSDIIDINNDGLADLIEMDMDPADNYRKKVLMSGYNYRNYQNNDLFGYQYQYVRNTLQLNRGPRLGANDSIGDPVFSDIGFYAGLSSTDWSWSPLVQDFDNDGFRDVIITNGFPKDLTDHDFISFREKSFATKTKKEVLDAIPVVRIRNYAFRNSGHLQFSNITNEWGLLEKSFSNGAAYADLDNDGDLDMVMSNINDKAFVYRNNAAELRADSAHYLAIKLTGNKNNVGAIGAQVSIHYGGQQQVIENSPYRGFLSTMPATLHFGLGTVRQLDSLVVTWPDGRKQKLTAVAANQQLQLDHAHAREGNTAFLAAGIAGDALFRDVTAALGIHYKHEETDYIDFNVQKLMPHKLSEYSPCIASGDINGDGLDDMVIGGAFGKKTVLLLQQPNGKFLQQELSVSQDTLSHEITALLLFDADGDHDLDLYLASGSNEAPSGAGNYQDQLYTNNGKGIFAHDAAALPLNTIPKACVRAVDIDKDGDLDLFVGGRSLPGNYPLPVSSQLLRNDSKNGKPLFTDITASNAPGLNKIGMVCDATWSDYDNDGWPDLLLAGEWMPLTIFRNQQGKLTDVSEHTGVDKQAGWFNCITSGDYDHDGDTDYVMGNLGSNSFYQASDSFPVSVYANDFYKQGKVQCVVTLYLKDKPDGQWKEFTVHNRDDVVDQLPFIKKRFLTYADFGKATFDRLFTPEEMKTVVKYQANQLRSVLLRNQGNGKFTAAPLPAEAQFSTVNSLLTADFDQDGHLDVFLNTNDFGADPANGRYDAGNGLLLKGDGKGGFRPLTLRESGIFLPGSGRGLAPLAGPGGTYLLAIGQNRGMLKVFQKNKP